MRTTDTFTAVMPLDFFVPLLPFNAELLNGNAILVRACGAQAADGSVLRSKEYLLFGHGMATIAMWSQHPFAFETQDQYVITVTEREDPRTVKYWEIQSRRDQTTDGVEWTLCVATTQPDPKKDGEIRMLIKSEGHARQYFFLRHRHRY